MIRKTVQQTLDAVQRLTMYGETIEETEELKLDLSEGKELPGTALSRLFGIYVGVRRQKQQKKQL